jgi:hypothetical protein
MNRFDIALGKKPVVTYTICNSASGLCIGTCLHAVPHKKDSHDCRRTPCEFRNLPGVECIECKSSLPDGSPALSIGRPVIEPLIGGVVIVTSKECCGGHPKGTTGKIISIRNKDSFFVENERDGGRWHCRKCAAYVS